MGVVRTVRVSFDNALSRSYWLWRANPALSVPTMMASSLQVVAESILGFFGIGFLLVTERNGSLEALSEALVNPTTSNLQTAYRVLTSGAFYLPFISIMVPGIILSVLAVVVASGFVYSAEFCSYQLALQGGRVGVPVVMSSFSLRWRAMAITYALSYFVTFLPAILLGLSGYLMFYLLGGYVGAAMAALFVSLGILGSAAAAALLIYTPVSVCADGTSGFSAISKSARLALANPGVSLTYSIVYLLLTGAIGVGAQLVPGVNLPLLSLASLGILILLTPVLHLTKATLFRELTVRSESVSDTYPPALSDFGLPLARMLWAKFRVGLVELKKYALVKSNLPFHAVAASAILLGWVTGIEIGRGGLDQVAYSFGYVPGKINPLVTGSLPLTVGVYVFFHNWQVSLATALSGLWYSVFSFGALFFNGVVVGVVSSLVPSPTMLAAAILPHGIIEIPSFVLAGSAGLKLGVLYYRASRGVAEHETMEGAVRQTLYMVVGLALLFFVAGLIEGNVTPWLMRLAGWS